MNIEVNTESRTTVEESFDRIAQELFHNYQIEINGARYRLLDIEFYYFRKNDFEDNYAHKHEEQLKSGHWYFHGSGMDITLGNGTDYGGILIRAVGKISGQAAAKNHISAEIHGPLKVKTELCSNLHGIFENKANTMQMLDVSSDRMNALMEEPKQIFKTSRIGINIVNDNPTHPTHGSKYRYIIFPHLKHKDKTKIANDIFEEFPELEKDGVNKLMGSKFL